MKPKHRRRASRIPPSLIGLLGPALSDAYTHAELDSLFMTAGAPGDPPGAPAVQYKRLTGKPLGITGEVAEYEAARILDLTLTEARQEGFDARKGGKRIQIKGRVLGKNAGAGQRIGTIRLDKKWDSVVLVLLDEQFLPTEIYEAGRKKIKAALIARFFQRIRGSR